MALETGTTEPPGGGWPWLPGVQGAAQQPRGAPAGAGAHGRCGRPQQGTTRATPRPAGTRTKTPFLGGLSLTELGTRVWREVRDDHCTGQAAQLAHYLFFAVFPFLLFLTTLLGYLPIPNLMDRILEYMASLLPGEAVTLLQDTIRQLVTNQKGGLLSFGILATLWSASSAVTALTEAAEPGL